MTTKLITIVANDFNDLDIWTESEGTYLGCTIRRAVEVLGKLGFSDDSVNKLINAATDVYSATRMLDEAKRRAAEAAQSHAEATRALLNAIRTAG